MTSVSPTPKDTEAERREALLVEMFEWLDGKRSTNNQFHSTSGETGEWMAWRDQADAARVVALAAAIQALTPAVLAASPAVTEGERAGEYALCRCGHPMHAHEGPVDAVTRCERCDSCALFELPAFPAVTAAEDETDVRRDLERLATMAWDEGYEAMQALRASKATTPAAAVPEAEDGREADDEAGVEWPSFWTVEQKCDDIHARYHGQKGNMLGEDECGWEHCQVWEAFRFALRLAPAVPARDDERERLAAVLRLCDEADSKTSITQGFVAARLIRAALAAAPLPEGQEADR